MNVTHKGKISHIHIYNGKLEFQTIVKTSPKQQIRTKTEKHNNETEGCVYVCVCGGGGGGMDG